MGPWPTFFHAFFQSKSGDFQVMSNDRHSRLVERFEAAARQAAEAEGVELVELSRGQAPRRTTSEEGDRLSGGGELHHTCTIGHRCEECVIDR